MTTTFTLLLRADDVLRGRRWSKGSENPTRTAATLSALIFLMGAIYGAAMGSFGGISPDRIPQIVYSATKVPLLLLATFALSLPTFYVLNMLLGVGTDFRLAVRALVSTQAGIATVLASLTPYTLFFYASSSNYQAAVLFNTMVFAIASFTGQWLLRKEYRILISRNSSHLWLMWGWIAIYAFVGIQMGWLLRPFIGSPSSPCEFFRTGEEWTNAYVIVARLIWKVLIS